MSTVVRLGKGCIVGLFLAVASLLGLMDAANAQDVAVKAATSATDPEPVQTASTSQATEPDRYRRAALYLAARAGDAELVQRLLQEGAAIDEPSRAGLTPLHAAAALGHVGVARLLLANCADRDARDFARRTPLHLAIAGGHGEMVELLLRDGADPVARRPGGTSALRAAERNRHIELTERLRQAEAPLQAPLATGASELDGAPVPAVSAGPANPLDARPRGTEGTRRFVQEKLSELGYDPGPSDGQLGGKTREAILAFQARIGQVSNGADVTRCLVDRLAIEAARRSEP